MPAATERTRTAAQVERKLRPLIVFPYWRQNPYVTVTVLAAATDGFEILDTNQYRQLIDALSEHGDGALFHLHWTSPICQQADSESDAYERLYDFQQAIASFHARGGKVIWTVHNAQPHELVRPGHERELVTFLAAVADRIHVMSPATVDLMEPIVQLPIDRVRRVPHPSYDGIYPVGRHRTDARAAIGCGPDDIVVSLIGQVRPYKGANTLLEAASEVRPEIKDKLVVVLAGRTPDDEVDALKAAFPSDVRVVLHSEFVPDAELTDWFVASDVCVFPYRRVLNSGSAHLAASMGVPVVLPGEAHLREQFDGQRWMSFYDPDDPVRSLAKLLSDESTFESHKAQAREFCREISPWRIAQKMLFDLYLPLAGRLDRDPLDTATPT